MNKKLIKSEGEYRKFAFDILKRYNLYNIEKCLGVEVDRECWDFNEKGQPINEEGEVLSDISPESMILCEEIKGLEYPVLLVYSFVEDWDRMGSYQFSILEFVTLKDFVV